MIHKIKTFDLMKNEKMFYKQQYNTKFFLNVEYVVHVLCVNFHHKHQIVFLLKSIFYIIWWMGCEWGEYHASQ